MRSERAYQGATRPGPERSPRRDVAHLIVLVGPWTLAGWLWWRVAQATTAEQLLWALGLVLLLAAISVPLSFAWIQYNIRIFQRKGPRTGRPSPDLDYALDWNGRAVVADWRAVRAASVVIVQPSEDRKTFRSSDGVES